MALSARFLGLRIAVMGLAQPLIDPLNYLQ